MKKVLNFLRKPWLFLGLTALSFLMGWIVTDVVRDWLGAGLFPELSVMPDAIQSFSISPEGKLALSDYYGVYSYVYCADPATGRMEWLLQKHDLETYCGPASRREVLFGDNGELFLHYVTWTDDDNAIQTEAVVWISADGKPGQVLCGMDYTDSDAPPTREGRMTAFRYADGILHYAYCDTDVTEFYSVNIATGTQTTEGSILWDDTFAGRVFAVSDGYLLAMSDGTVCRADENGTIGETIYMSTVSTASSWDSDLFLSVAELNGELYVLRSGDPYGVYRLTEYGPELVLSVHDLPGDSEENAAFCQIAAVGDMLYAQSYDCIVQWKDGETSFLQTDYRLNANHVLRLIPYFLYSFISIAAVIAFLIWLILFQKGLVAKQLLLMIPCTIVIMVVLLYTANRCIFDLYSDKQTEEMTAVCDLCRRTLDGDELQRIGQETDPSYYRSYHEKLLGFADYNRGSWNGGLDFTLCLPCDEYASYVYADSISVDIPFAQEDWDCIPSILEVFQEEGSDISSFYGFDDYGALSRFLGIDETSYEIVAPVYASDGSISAYLKVSTDAFYFKNNKYTYSLILLATAIPLSLLLLVLTSVIAVIMAHSLRRATVTVNKIADGDFSVRNNVQSRDEIGEICRQVDKMADNLHAMFEEKDANERFYYKFVPEKFRELLGKEKLTDLELGDAESREFTVLFCDIRSFSLNSEMLTAKENFEFVNIIYGIAGPIIREYGGFVDKYIGDAVMALFESADAAVEAGMALYRAIVLDPSTAARLHVSEINIGIGIHTGMARIGIVGENERLSGTVISDTVNLSSRLESLTKTYQTAMLLSKDTLDKMEHPESVGMRYLGMVQVAGVNEVRSVYEVLDCLDEKRREARSANSADFREAVRLFHMGKRREAANLLATLDDTEDPVVSMYLTYIRSMSDDDKGNVFRFVRK